MQPYSKNIYFIYVLSLPRSKTYIMNTKKEENAENITNIFFVQRQLSDMLVDTVLIDYTMQREAEVSC